MELTLDLEGGKYVATIILNGVPCHLEAVNPVGFELSYNVDDDPEYVPKVDHQGHAFLLVPFARKAAKPTIKQA